jgi:hypothetical protein
MTDDETASTLQPFNDSRFRSVTRFLSVAHSRHHQQHATELTRLKVFYVLLVFGLLLIGSSIFMAQFSFQQEFQILKDVSLGAISMFTSLLAIVATARMLPRDIEDRTFIPFSPSRCRVSNTLSVKLPEFFCCWRSALW